MGLVKYTLSDNGEIVKAVEQTDKTGMWFESRAGRPSATPSAGCVYRPVGLYCGGRSCFYDHYTGIGTKSYTPSTFVFYNEQTKRFEYNTGGNYVTYDSKNITLTRTGLYKINFDYSKLKDHNHKKKFKKEVRHLLKSWIRDCISAAKKYTQDYWDYKDFECEYRALNALREGVERMFENGKRVNEDSITEVFINPSYRGEFCGNEFNFDKYLKSCAKDLITELAETKKK